MKLFNYIMPLLMISTLSYCFQARMARVQERQRVSELIRAIKNAPNLEQVQALNDQVRSLIKNQSYEQDYQALLNTTVSERKAELMAQQPVVTQQAAPEVRPGRRAPQILTNQDIQTDEQFADILSALRAAPTQELQNQEKQRAQSIIETVRNTNPYKARSMQRDLQMVEQSARRNTISPQTISPAPQIIQTQATANVDEKNRNKEERRVVQRHKRRTVRQKESLPSGHSLDEIKTSNELTNQLENANQVVNNHINIINNLANENRFRTMGWLAWIPMLSSINFSKVLAQPDLIMLNRDQIGSLLGAVETNVHEIVAALQTIAKNDKANECNKNPMIRQHVDAIQQKITSLNAILQTAYNEPIIKALADLNTSTATQQRANRELLAILETSSELVDKIIKHLQHDTPNAFRPTR